MDPVIEAFINACPSEQPELDSQPDAFDKFLADGQLAAALGRHGWERVALLAEETVDANERFRSLKPPAERANYRETRKSANWDAELIPESQALVKMATASDRRKAGLREWMRTELALGKTAGELVAHAARHDSTTANLLREVAAELGQET